MAAAVDEERRRPRHPRQVWAVDVAGDPRGEGPMTQVVGEPLGVEAELVGVMHEIREAQRILMLEQQVVHRPEGTLLVSSLRRLRGHPGMRMYVVQREV